jgi:DNA-directed RNA polymerase III subunit RPC3
LPLRHLRHGLAVLLQQNLIYYHHDADSRVTYYEANQDASYLLLRSGKIIEFIYTRYGASARDIAQNLLYLGHAKIGELLDKTASDNVSKIALKAAIEEARRASAANEQENEDGVENGIEEAKHEPFTNGVQNGSIDHDHTTVPKDLPEALCHLLEAGIIEPVVRRMFHIPSDIYSQVEKEITRDHFGGSLKGTKQKDELKHKVMEKLRDLRSEGRAWQSTGTKRSLNGNHHNGGEKRRKLTNGDSSINGGSHGHHIESDRFDVGFLEHFRVGRYAC